MKVPYVDYVTLNDQPLDRLSFPGKLPFTQDLHVDFDSPVTFFVGENGSGKSTLLEAMAVLARLPISGGGLNEMDANHAFAELIEAVRFLFRACLARFQDRERRPFRRGTTNRGHLRRYRGSQFFVPLETLVTTIELKWYGEEVCDAADYQACRQAHAEVVSILREPICADAA